MRTPTRKTLTKEFCIEEYSTTVEVTATFDHIHYGYDADGFRGEYRWEMDKQTYTIPDKNDFGVFLSATEKLEITLRLEEKLKDYEWRIDNE